MLTLSKIGFRVQCTGSIKERKIIREATSLLHPDRFNIPLFLEDKWDGYIRKYRSANKTFPIGLLHYVETALKEKKIRYKLDGFDEEDDSWIKFSKLISADDRDYQRAAIKTFFQHRIGILKVPTRGGKTFIASECIRLALQNNKAKKFIFLVDSVDIYKQAIGDIAGFLKVPTSSIGKIREKDFSIDKPVIIAMVQTLQSIMRGKDLGKKKGLKRLYKEVDFFILDEVQEYGASKVRQKIINSFKKLKYFLSLSGSPYKSENPVGNFNIEAMSGGIIYDIEEKELQKRKVLSENKILLFWIKRNVEEDGDYRLLKRSYILRDYQRNNIIISTLRLCQQLKLKTLGIFASTEHGFFIEKLSGYRFIHGNTSDKERSAEKASFLAGKGKVLLASWIWKKGVTLPEVEVLFNIDGGKEQSLAIQIRGRVLGTTQTKKKSLFIDFIDDVGEYFSQHSFSRIMAYEEKVGKENIDVLDVNDPNFSFDLQSYLSNWFEKSIVE